MRTQTFDSEDRQEARCTARRLFPGIGYVVWGRCDGREIRRFLEEPRHHLIIPWIHIDFADAPGGFSITADDAVYQIEELARERSVGEECGCGNGFVGPSDVKAFAVIVTDESSLTARWLPLCDACSKLVGEDLEHAVRIAYQPRDGTAAEREYQESL